MAPKNRTAAPAGGSRSKHFPGGKRLGDDQKPFFQFDRIGTKLVGEFLRMEPFKNGHIARVKDEDGEVQAFSAPVQLARILEGVKPGTSIGIAFVEERPSERGNPVKIFEVAEL